MECPFKIVEIEINTDCNLSCSYCPNHSMKRVEEGSINQELLLKIITQLQEMEFSGTISPSFYNEPLLNNKLSEIVKFIRFKLPKSSLILYTNALLLNQDKFMELSTTGVSRFVITKHENIKKIPLDKFFNNLSDKEKEKIKYQSFHEINLTNRGGLIESIDNQVKPLTPCQIPQFQITITKEGKVLPCFEDYEQKLEMGDLKKDSLLEIWNSTKYKEFRLNLKRGLRHKYSPCENCSRVEALAPAI